VSLLFDSIDPLAIPAGEAAAGYIDGRWPWAADPAKRARFKSCLLITVSGLDADAADIETTDMTPAMAGPWARRQRNRGLRMPIVYCNRSNGPAVEASLDAKGFSPGGGEVALWISTLDGTQVVSHWINGSAVRYPVWAVQYEGSRLTGRNYDLSIVSGTFGPGGGSLEEDMNQSVIFGLVRLALAAFQGPDHNPPGDPATDPTIIALAAQIKPDGSNFDTVMRSFLADPNSAPWVNAAAGLRAGKYALVSQLPTTPGDDDSSFVTKAALKAAVGTL
jgi:hypothetical protein